MQVQMDNFMGSHPETKESQKTVERRRLRLSQAWASLLVVQCKLMRPERICTSPPKQDWVVCLYVWSVCIVWIVHVHVYTHMYNTCICICNDHNKKDINRRMERHGRVWRECSCKGLKRRMEGRECFSSTSFKNIFLKKQKNESQVSSYSRFRSNVIKQIVYFS